MNMTTSPSPAESLTLPLSPERTEVTVRMYRVGFGDCFLLTFQGGGIENRAFRMLIDCGSLGRTGDDGQLQDTNEYMQQVVKDIRQKTGGEIDLLVVTHEHWDHVSGFRQATEIFRDMLIHRVWLPWTEQATDPLVKDLDRRNGQLLEALAFALNHPRQSKERKQEIHQILAFAGDLPPDDITAELLLAAVRKHRTRDARDLAVSFVQASNGKLEYLYPCSEKVPCQPRELSGLPNVRLYILGPPYEAQALRRSNRWPTSKEPLEQNDRRTLLGEAFLAAVQPEDELSDEERRLVESSMPFGERLRVSAEQAETIPLFQDTYGFWAGKHHPEAWRRIDDDWLVMAEDLAMHLDNYTNNTSLALAIELVQSGKVLLFVGDAQVGNWLSWQNRSWSVREKKNDLVSTTVTTKSLLEQTVLYKVGHHGSHNATAGVTQGSDMGLAWMTDPNLVAMIPVDEQVATNRGWRNIPDESALMPELEKKTRGRILRSDRRLPSQRPADTSTAEWDAFNAAVKNTELYIQYTVRDEPPPDRVALEQERLVKIVEAFFREGGLMEDKLRQIACDYAVRTKQADLAHRDAFRYMLPTKDEDVKEVFKRLLAGALHFSKEKELWAACVNCQPDLKSRLEKLGVLQQGGVPNNLGTHFVDVKDDSPLVREAEITEILQRLSLNQACIPIVGNPGLGKTRLALEIARRAGAGDLVAISEPFKYVVWVSARPTQPRDQSTPRELLSVVLESLATVLQIQNRPDKRSSRGANPLVRRFTKLLDTNRVLVIIDNFDSVPPKDDLISWVEERQKLPESGSCVVLTARNKDKYPPHLRVELKELLPDQKRKFIEPKVTSKQSPESKADLLSVLGAMPGNPLALNYCIGLSRGGSVESLQLVATDVPKAPEQIARKTFERTWDHLSEDAQKLLRPVPLFGDVINADVLYRVSRLPSEIRHAVHAELREFQILQDDPGVVMGTSASRKEVPITRFKIHPVVKEVVQDVLTPEEEKRFRFDLAREYDSFVAKIVTRDNPKERYWNALVTPAMSQLEPDWPTLLEILEWAKAVAEEGRFRENPDSQEASKILLNLVLQLVHFMDTRFHNQSRIKFVTAAINSSERLNAEPGLRALLRIDALGWAYLEQGDTKGALEEIQQGLNRAGELATQNDDVTRDQELELRVRHLHALGHAWKAIAMLEENKPQEASDAWQEASDLYNVCPPVVKYRLDLAGGDIALMEALRKNPLDLTPFENQRRKDAGRKARGYFESAVTVSDEYGGEGDGYQTSPRIGLAHLLEGNLVQAEECFTRLSMQKGSRVGRLYGDYGEGLVMFMRGDRGRARRKIREAEQDPALRESSSRLIELMRDFYSQLEEESLL